MLRIAFRIPGGRWIALAALFILLGAPQAVAGPDSIWTLQQSSGSVHLLKSGFSPIALTLGDQFSEGDWIETGPDGRAVLVRGDDMIVIAPNSQVGLPRETTGSIATRILHRLGTIMLTVEKQAKQHFEVKTPYLAAVVKGTTFTVSIQEGRTAVHVVEGLVEVRDLFSGETGLVRPGLTGTVLSRGGSGVTIGTGAAPVAPAKAKALENSAEPSAGPGRSGGPDTEIRAGVAANAPGKAEKLEKGAEPSAHPQGKGGSEIKIRAKAGAVATGKAKKKHKSKAGPSAGPRRSIVIREQIGPRGIDLMTATDSLVRAAETGTDRQFAAPSSSDMALSGSPPGSGLSVDTTTSIDLSSTKDLTSSTTLTSSTEVDTKDKTKKWHKKKGQR